MKTPSAYLFDLIKSLTVSEKRYFSVYAGRHYADNRSLRLFQIIGAQQQYNEDAAIKETGLNRNNFAVQKKILYDQVLAALSQYDVSGDEALKLQQNIFSCHKLLQKGLIDQAIAKLKQAKKAAAEYEFHEAGIQALQVEAMIQARLQYKNMPGKDLHTWYKESRMLTEKIQTYAYCKYVNSQAQKIQIEAGGKNALSAAAVKGMLDEASGKIRAGTMTDKARMDLLQTEALYYFMSQDTIRAKEVNITFITLMEAKKHWIYFYPQRYFSALNNYLIDCFQLKIEDELRSGLDKMRSLQSHPAFKVLNLLPNIFRITYQLELNYLISQGQFSVALVLIPPVSDGLLKYGSAIPLHHRMNLQYLCAYIYFGAGRYKPASAALDILQQEGRNDTATIPDCASAIMQVICHYELKNYSIIDSLVKSCKRKLSQQKASVVPDAEFDLLNGIASFAITPPGSKDWERLWKKCTHQAKTKGLSPYSSYFDYFAYLTAKVNKTSYRRGDKIKIV